MECPVLLNNGRCDEDKDGYNTTGCGYDGTDCINLWPKQANCSVDNPAWIGHGVCQL